MDPAAANVVAEQIWSFHTFYQILIGSAVVTMVINVTWFFISGALDLLMRRLRLRVKTHSFILGRSLTRAEYERWSRDISGFSCLLVRYGIDEYLSRIASDQERSEGRQQLRMIPVSVSYDLDHRAVFGLRLPVHTSLGTQFKCFVVARSLDRVPAVVAMLQTCEHVGDIKPSDSYHRERVYFLLDQFTVVDTLTAGVKNNYVFPE